MRATLGKPGWQEVGEREVLRVYLTSQVRVEHGDTLIGERDLPGRQGRVALALLVAERDRPVTRDEALDCTVECAAANGEMAEAIQAAEDALAIEPFRETTYQRLMRVHAAAGHRAEALRAYQRCCNVLAEELGVPPSPETDAVYTAIVQA